MSNQHEMKRIRNEFHRNGYYCFKNFSFLPKDVLTEIFSEVKFLVSTYAQKTDITVKTTENSPRKFQQVNQPTIKEYGKLIPNVYENKDIKNFLGYIANDEITSAWEYEQTLITKLTEPGDTHGWHWGDYPYTLIWIVEHPTDPNYGALLQCIPHTFWEKGSNDMIQYILDNQISTKHHLAGDVYFLKSDTTLHQVTPLNKSTTRIMLNTCWASANDNRKNVGHETIEQIWGTK